MEKARVVKWVGSATLTAPARVNRDRASLVLPLMSLTSLFEARGKHPFSIESLGGVHIPAQVDRFECHLLLFDFFSPLFHPS